MTKESWTNLTICGSTAHPAQLLQ